jgi:hypothetical protein
MVAFWTINNHPLTMRVAHVARVPSPHARVKTWKNLRKSAINYKRYSLAQ